jgi:hypothetical protein
MKNYLLVVVALKNVPDAYDSKLHPLVLPEF